MKAIILAAGYATRLYPLTKNQPKPLLKIADKAIIEYLLDGFRAIPALDEVFVVTNEKFSQLFRTWAGETEQTGDYPFAITIVNDRTTSNETRLGAIADIQFVLNAHRIDDDLLVAAGDNIFQFDVVELYQFFLKKQHDVIVTQELNDPVRLRTRGVVQFDEQYKVIGFEEKPEHPKSNFVCPALYIHRRENVLLYHRYLMENNNPDAPGFFIKWLYTKTPVYAFVMSKPAIDIGTLESYKTVCEQFEQNHNIH